MANVITVFSAELHEPLVDTDTVVFFLGSNRPKILRDFISRVEPAEHAVLLQVG